MLLRLMGIVFQSAPLVLTQCPKYILFPRTDMNRFYIGLIFINLVKCDGIQKIRHISKNIFGYK